MRSLEISWERARMVKEWRTWAGKIVSAVKEVLGEDAGVYVFGSAVKNQLTAASDIDILIISEKAPKSLIERAYIKSSIIEKAGLPLVHPFELHLADMDEAEIYFRHVKEIIKLA